jgi:hypothetical protein
MPAEPAADTAEVDTVATPLVPQVGDRVVVKIDAQRFEGPANLAYFEEELLARGYPKLPQWCVGCVTNERGHILAKFPHTKRKDEMTVFIVNVDGKGLIAIAAEGLKLRLWCGATVQLLPRHTVEMKGWRSAALTLFSGVTTVPADTVERCVGVTEACLPHPQGKSQFVWLVRLVDAENVFTLAHSVDLRPWTHSDRQGRKHMRQIVAMVPASSHTRPACASFTFQGVGAAAMSISVDTDDSFLERHISHIASLECTPYLQRYFLAAPDDNFDYM